MIDAKGLRRKNQREEGERQAGRVVER